MNGILRSGQPPGAVLRGGRRPWPLVKSLPPLLAPTATSKVHNAGILLKLDVNVPVCAASKIIFCQMSLSTSVLFSMHVFVLIKFRSIYCLCSVVILSCYCVYTVIV